MNPIIGAIMAATPATLPSHIDPGIRFAVDAGCEQTTSAYNTPILWLNDGAAIGFGLVTDENGGWSVLVIEGAAQRLCRGEDLGGKLGALAKDKS